MVRGDGSQHFVELIDTAERTVTFIRRVGHCRKNDFDLPRTSDIDDGFDVTSKDPELTRIQRTLRQFPGDPRGGFYEHTLRIGVQGKTSTPGRERLLGGCIYQQSAAAERPSDAVNSHL